MGLLTQMGTGQGWLKAGFLGFAGSGKTYTAVSLALGLREHLGISGPIAMFDTEAGSEYVAQRVKKETGIDLIGVRSRSFSDLCAVTREAEAGNVSVLIVDSITHVWREVMQAYLDEINRFRERKGWGKKTRMEFQDWATVKDRWAEWPDLYLNSKLHIVIAGRAGFEWDFEERQDSKGKVTKELVKTGTKMRVESEFGFEPSLLIEMERIQIRTGAGELTKQFVRKATILKDRFDAIDGATADNPTYEFFKPHIDLLVPGAYAPVDTATKTAFGVDEDGDDIARAERKERAILAEKVQAALVEAWPGQTKEDKRAKVAALREAFGTPSWTEVENLPTAVLRDGLGKIEVIAATALEAQNTP